MKRKIYLACRHDPQWGSIGTALAEDGHGIAQHSSSSPEWSQRDLGLHGSTFHHDDYDKHFGPGNWELEWVADVKTHAGWQAAMVLNRAIYNQDTPRVEAAVAAE